MSHISVFRKTYRKPHLHQRQIRALAKRPVPQAPVESGELQANLDPAPVSRRFLFSDGVTGAGREGNRLEKWVRSCISASFRFSLVD